ncbi:2-polyprenyl-3-methyl-5-hydroxy-6-metoxy-1,4- benzoquinol methylase [Synechococcus sp. BL107]|nr:2-polyprenyl-3-methyl-5-hydroxy-6-metoxy-1,4- benzoquinol methylase [Synechococcus sp. BL107]
MIYLDPVFKDNKLVDYYKKNNTEQSSAHENEYEFYKNIYSQGLVEIIKHCKNGKLLDVGCSSGLFLDLCREKGYKTYGIELNESELNITRHKEHKAWGKPIQQLELDEQFDVISMWDVFEHIKDGNQYLEYLNKLLKPEGIIFLQIPSSNSLAARILREKCNMFDGIEHVNLYGTSTIKRVAKNAGFTIVSMISVIDELGPIGNYLSYEDPYQGKFQEGELGEILSKQAVLDQLLGYKLQIILKPEQNREKKS